MLTNTFAHLPGIGEKTEQKLWTSGWHDWAQCLGVPPDTLPRVLASPMCRERLAASLDHYQRGDYRYFEQHLPAPVKWRAFGPWRDNTLYVDIETTGASNEITVLGVYDGRRYRAFIADKNLEAGLACLEEAAVVVTYNGTGFDLPIIRARFPYNLFNHVHIDLMWPLRRLGYRGGLKRIEQQLGLERSPATRALSGWDAVTLWHDYRRGHQQALDWLLAYNEEDVRNLEPLMQVVYQRLSWSF